MRKKYFLDFFKVLAVVVLAPIVFLLYLLLSLALESCDSTINKFKFENKKYIIIDEASCFRDRDIHINGVNWSLYEIKLFRKVRVGSFAVGIHHDYPAYNKEGSALGNFYGPKSKINLKLDSGEQYCYLPYKNIIEPWTEECTTEAMRLLKHQESSTSNSVN